MKKSRQPYRGPGYFRDILILLATLSLGAVSGPAQSQDQPAGPKLLRSLDEVPEVARPDGEKSTTDVRPESAVKAVSEAEPAAQEPAAMRLTDLARESSLHRRSLAEFLEFQKPLKLMRPAASYTFDIPVSARMEILSGETEVHYTNSISLREDISQLALSWGDSLLAQVPLMQKSPSGRIREELPGAPFEAGYHGLRIDIAQHYAREGECEDPSSPTLWTQIDTAESTIAFDYRLRELNPVLADLRDLIDSRLWGDYELSIVTASTYASNSNQLRWGSLVAQRAALLLDYKPLAVAHATQLLPGRDQVVIGSRQELEGILPRDILASVSDAFVGVYPHPLNADRFMLVLSGLNERGVDQAVNAMALYNDSLPAVATMDVTSLEVPEFEPYEADRTLIARDRADFSELGFETETRTGMGADPYHLEFRIPPDIYAPENAMLKFNLHFAHGAALREDSVFNIMLNERFESAIYLKEADGAVYRDYQVEIPLRSFRPGKNRIAFEANMVPMLTGHCEMVNDKNLLFTLFDDSELRMPSADHYVRLPDLQLFGWTAFPATIDPLGEGMTIVVSSPDSETMASAWMLAGKMAQVVGQPLVDLEVTGTVPAADRHWIAVGAVGDISPDLLRGAPVQFGSNGRVPAVLARVPAERVGLQEERRMEAGHQTSILRGSNSAGDRGIVMQFQSPLNAEKAGMLVLAEDRMTLRQRVAELVHPGVWDSMKGDTLVWYGIGKMESQRLGDSFYLGEPGLATAAAYHFSDRPWLGIGLAVIAVILLALFAKRVLAKFQKRHHGMVQEGSQSAA